VHLAGCPSALTADPQRRVPVAWKAGEATPRPIRLEVLCVDQPGLLAAMSKAIASVGVNISTAEVKTTGNDGRALSLFELKVSNAQQLSTLMHSIAAIDGVMRVSRVGLYNNNNQHRV
jgi:(p)ppGpp synthase/HD superfamily hydrolase